MPKAAQRKSITLGTTALEGVQKSSVRFGSYKQSSDGSGGFQTEPVRWRVLRRSEGLVWLLSDKILDTYYYHSEDGWYHDVYWQDTLMKQWLNSELEEGGFSDEAFSPEEFKAIALKEERLGRVLLLSRDETEDPEWYANGRTALLAKDSDYTASGGTVGARNFGKNGAWVLREDKVTAYVYYVDSDGQYTDIMYGDYFIFAVRPFVYIDEAKVLFTSPAVGGKTAMGLTAVFGYDGEDYKLTVKDDERNGFLAKLRSYAGNIVQFDYEGAKTGGNEYLSAMVLNGETVKYYGRLKNVGAAGEESGTLTLTLPVSVDAERGDRLFVFNEQCNGDGKTDYASSLCELALKSAGAAAPRLRIHPETDEWEVSYDEGPTWTALGVKATGMKGDKGDAGADGATPQLKIGSDALWYVSHDGGTTWTSLGVKATGADGKDGQPGAEGKDGTTPQLKIGSDALWYVSHDGGETWISLGVKAFGDKGEKGDRGEKGDEGDKGDNGADGRIPFIGENGNWWVGEKDTGVKASAAAAAAGDLAGAEKSPLAILAIAVAGVSLLINIVLISYTVLKKKKSPA